MIGSPARELGSIYTPPAIARRMVVACLDCCLGLGSAQLPTSPCRILDPACGDGAFLIEVFDELCRRLGNAAADVNRRLGIVRDHIFGADIDPAAVDTLQARLLDRIGGTGTLPREAAAVVEQNIRCGDSLTGAVRVPDRATPIDDSLRQSPTGSINWQLDFPAAAAAGGFDVVIGNPPYVRERNAKPLFDSLAATELGRRWREARMDLWFYFLHRGLDLLRPGGTLSFIVNSYWTSSRGASRLIDRLARETHFEEIVLLEDAPVFAAVTGRHMIFRLRKQAGVVPERLPDDRPCRIVLGESRRANARAGRAKPTERSNRRTVEPEEYVLTQRELFQNGRLIVAPADVRHTVFVGRKTLGQSYETRQGMAENPPAINRRLHEEFAGRYEIDEGVFVLGGDEVARLGLSATERRLLRPYFDTRVVGRYRLPDEATQQVLYLTRHTAESLEGLPAVATHLARFRPILERRREVREGKSAWWHLHWPRDEGIFLKPRILAVQMGRRPQFVFAERPTFVGFSVNLIVRPVERAIDLAALTGILNSDLAASWFDRHAKRRGVNLEINAHVLREFPLPGFDDAIARQVGSLVRERQSVHADDPRAARLERAIEDYVARLYDIAAPVGG